jgi:hypothetical protein
MLNAMFNVSVSDDVLGENSLINLPGSIMSETGFSDHWYFCNSKKDGAAS